MPYAARGGGFGIVGSTERVTALGGTLHTGPRKNPRLGGHGPPPHRGTSGLIRSRSFGPSGASIGAASLMGKAPDGTGQDAACSTGRAGASCADRHFGYQLRSVM